MALTELLLASQNKGKLAEMRLLLQGLPFRVISPAELGITEAPEETGATFVENATLKAVHYSRVANRLAVADDSGISVDALDGRPGLLSARFGGEGASDDDRNALLLSKLKGLPPEKRGAHFTCAVVVARPRGSGPPEVLFQAEEKVHGLIAEAPRGPNGFGYDPIFFFPPYGRTFGEVAHEEKDKVSHRGKAFARLRAFLEGART
jgi:XTP/dITP diphosphohydrolase